MSAGQPDVVVLGAGPAGSAVAVALRQAGCEVAVLDRARLDRPRPGESLGGEVGPLARRLGIDGALAGQPPFVGVRSAWGGPEPADRPALLRPFGAGWHVDRARFDRALARRAADLGAAVRLGVDPPAITRRGDRWVVTTGDLTLRAPYLIDATGRGAPGTSGWLPDRRWLKVDRLVAVVSAWRGGADPGPDLLLEAVERGWWYSAPQPGGDLLAVWVTDGDLLAGRGLLAAQVAAADAPLTAERLRGRAPIGAPWVARADSGALLPDRGPGWCALGDAAFAWDPLGGSGVARALEAALDRAPGVVAALDGRPAPGVPPALAAYLDARGAWYGVEARWPDAPFWRRRRRPAAGRVTLSPDRALVPGEGSTDGAEAWLPLGVVRDLLAALPATAAAALAAARGPLDDRRLLLGLQALVASGAAR